MAIFTLNLGHDHTPVVWSGCAYHLIYNPKGLKPGQKMSLLINGHTLTFTKGHEDMAIMEYWDPFQTEKPLPGREVRLCREPIMLGQLFTYFEWGLVNPGWNETTIPYPVTAIGITK